MKYKLFYQSYFDLPIGDYFTLLDEMKKVSDTDELGKSTIVVKYLYKLTENELNSLSLDEFKELLNNLPDPTKDHTDYKLTTWTGAKKTLLISGEEFIFSPDLTKFSLAQYIDFQMSLSKTETNPEFLLSTILIPKGYNYNDGYDSNDNISWIRNNVSIGLSNQIINFFIKRYLASINHTVFFSTATTRALMWMSRGTKKTALKEALKAKKELQQVIKSMLTFA